MSPLPARVLDREFERWRDRVAMLVERMFGVSLTELPELPLEAGFEIGDSPAEFVAGCAADYAEGVRVRGPSGHEPAWPPPG